MSWFSPNHKATDEPATHIGTGIRLDDPTRRISISIPDKHLNRGLFGFGTTGVGKSKLLEYLIEQKIRKGRSVIYFDPKSDQGVFTKTFQCCQETGRLSEMQLITPTFPEYSAAINPMAYSFMSDELVSHVVSGIDVKDAFFRDVAKLIVIPVINGNLILAREEGRQPDLSFLKVYNGIRMAALGELRNSLNRIGGNEAAFYAGMLDRVLAWTPEYYAKVSTTLEIALVAMTAGNIGRIIGQADSNRLIRRMEENRPVIAIVHTGTMLVQESAAILGRVLLSMIQACIGRAFLSNRETMKPGLTIIIDEAQSVLTTQSLDLFAKAGAADVEVIAFAQSVNQIYAALGDENIGRTALDNTNTKIFMKCSDAETSEYVVKHFGVHDALQGVFGNSQVTTRQVERDVLKVQDILDLQPQEFYMVTYNGRFRGRTADVEPANIKIRFPDAPGTAMATREQQNSPDAKQEAA
jgi:hypothetical protein